MRMRFIKMHGLGNDFVFAGTELDEAALPELSRRLCDRRTGIGADGLVLTLPSAVADARMRIINSDGSEAAMCGNAIRCFAKYAYESGRVKSGEMRIETLSGVKEASLELEGGAVKSVRIGMGAPRFLSDGARFVTVNGEQAAYWPVDTGVPHAVIFVDDPKDGAHMQTGAALEWAKPFPKGTNVDFIRVLDRDTILMRVWERGCGETLCCGTGATAAAAIAHREGLVNDAVSVRLTLGELVIRRERGLYSMTGPAEYVFEGEIEL